MTNTKPSKKTEWPRNWVDRFYGKFVFSDGYIAEQKPAKILRFFKSVLHQRDNEIREKIQGMRKGLPSVRPEGRYILHQIDGYNNALDDLLTYLSKNNEKI